MPLVQAHITKVEQEIGSDWGQIHTDHGEVKKLSTKRAELLAEAAGFKNSGVLVGIDYTEQVKTVQSDTGPRVYHNYYYNGAGALHNGGGAGPAQQQQIPGVDMVQPQGGRKTDPDDAWRMCLNKGGELAVLTLPLLPDRERTPADQLVLARFWAEFFFFTPRPTQAPEPTASSYEPRDMDAPPPYNDDDIPY